MTRDQAVREIELQLRPLTITDESFESRSATRDLITLKTEIEVLEIALDGTEPWLVEWLKKSHSKGALLNQGGVSSYQHEQKVGTAFPYNVDGRAHLVKRFNAWSQNAVGQLISYENSNRSGDVLAPWIVELDAFKASPTSTY